jgi:FkbM family methyltransferase
MVDFNDVDDMLADVPADSSNQAVSVDSLLEEAALARRIGDAEAALSAYGRVLARHPGHVAAQLSRSELCRASGRPRDAVRSCLMVLDANPDHLGARLELAEALRDLGRSEDAHAIYGVLLREQPNSAAAWHGLARLLAEEGCGGAARASLRRALALDPAFAPARLALARQLAAAGEHEAAIDAYHDALATTGDAAAHAGMAVSLIALRRLDEAGERLERALAADDENVEARLARAAIRLLRGDLPGSWDDAEWRWHLPGAMRPTLPGEPWEGGPLDGATILLYAERGISDTLQMARYVPLLAGRGARVLLVVHPSLVALLSGLAGVERVLPVGEPLPAAGLPAIDFNAALLDLPRLLGTTLFTIPAAPYIEAPAERRRPIMAPPGTLLKVGLAWAGGSDPAAALPFAQVLPLAERADLAVFALQLGPHAADVAALAHPALITDLSPTVADFADLAGRIAEMDVVVTADAPLAHLAGAMGKPVWLVLPHAPDPRWMLERDDSPWYAAMRLFRQDEPGDWRPVLSRVKAALDVLAGEAASRNAALLRDASGSRAAQRAFLGAHLQAGDLLIDVEAGDGLFTLDAAAHPSGDVRVLAFDPHPADADFLRDSVAIAGVADMVEVVNAAVGDRSDSVLVSKFPRNSRRVFPLPDWVNGHSDMVALDGVLADRPDIAGRRLVVRLGQVGWEAEILDGLWESMALGQIAVLLFEHRPGSPAAEMVAGAGYTLWRFPSDVAAGRLAPFADERGQVLALAPGLDPADHYGPTGLPDRPAAIAAARAEAHALAAEGLDHHRNNRLGEAARSYGRALMRDPAAADANANLGVLLRTSGRSEAAIICYRRALARERLPAVWSNLGNVLREGGHLAEAEAAYRGALAAEPDNAQFIYNLALLRRDQNRHRESAALLERVLANRPTARGIAWERAQALLRSGDLAGGFALFENRRKDPEQDGTPAWGGEDLAARSLLVHDEGDAIDAVMLARFIPLTARQGALVTVECLPELAPLMAGLPGVEDVVPRGTPLPECELRVALPDLPHLLGVSASTLPHTAPYLSLPDDVAPHRFPHDGRLRVGLAWSGRPREHACPLSDMVALAALPHLALVSLQRDAAAALAAAGVRAIVEDLGSQQTDLARVAALIASLDLVVAGDTVEAHLAGAMGKPVWVLLPNNADWRWPEGRDDSPWYPTMRVFRQSPDGSWQRPVARLVDAAAALAAAKLR